MFIELDELQAGGKVRFQPYCSDADAFEVTSFIVVNGMRIKATARQCVNPSKTVTLEYWQRL